MSDRKKPTAGFWITVSLVAVVVGYPLSFGPACWIVPRLWARGLMPQLVADALWKFYAPLRSDDLPASFAEARDWYGNLFLPDFGVWP
jgi:hypothetical protein